MAQTWPKMTQNDWLCPRMTYQRSKGHQGVRGGARGHEGAPGGARWDQATPDAKISDKTAMFKVTKNCPGPKGMVLKYFWCIWGHLDALRQSYLLKTQIGRKPDFRGKNALPFPQARQNTFWLFLYFSTQQNVTDWSIECVFFLEFRGFFFKSWKIQ